MPHLDPASRKLWSEASVSHFLGKVQSFEYKDVFFYFCRILRHILVHIHLSVHSPALQMKDVAFKGEKSAFVLRSQTLNKCFLFMAYKFFLLVQDFFFVL